MMNETIVPPRPRSKPFLHLGLVALGIAAGVGGTLLLRPRSDAHAHAPAQGQAAAPRKQMFQCPMHPQIMQDHPGDCPICGMALVPMEGEPAKGPEGAGTDTRAAVTIDLERQQLIGLRTEKAATGPVAGDIRTTGRVAVDETRIRRTNVKVEGFVEKVFVDFVGKPVAKGAPLFTFYSPEFVSAQREYLLALRTQKAMTGGALQGSGADLLEAAKRRLQLWDVPAEAIVHLERTGEVQRALTLRSPISGVVTARTALLGARITPADVPFEITDLSRVWVLADVYEAELGRVKAGMAAELALQAFPGRTFKGRVAFLDPLLDPKTRTARVRLEFANGSGELKPEMFGEVLLKGQGRKGLLVPLDAVLDAGASKVVFVALGNGKFEPREVTVGATAGEKAEILSGLRAGEDVVVRANFLVDSESRLKAALAHMGSSPAAAPAGGHGH